MCMELLLYAKVMLNYFTQQLCKSKTERNQILFDIFFAQAALKGCSIKLVFVFHFRDLLVSLNLCSQISPA